MIINNRIRFDSQTVNILRTIVLGTKVCYNLTGHCLTKNSTKVANQSKYQKLVNESVKLESRFI